MAVGHAEAQQPPDGDEDKVITDVYEESWRAPQASKEPEPAPAETPEVYTPPPQVDITPPQPTVYVVEHKQPSFLDRVGLDLTAGGGVSDFAGAALSSITEAGGSWTARLQLGTKKPFGVEAAYIGTANHIETLGLDSSTLISNGLESALLWHIAQVPLSTKSYIVMRPYLLAGMAWKHYNVSGDAFNTSSVRESDDVLEVPLGFGLGFDFAHFVTDARFDYRPALDSDLVSGESSGMQTWQLSARIGVEF